MNMLYVFLNGKYVKFAFASKSTIAANTISSLFKLLLFSFHKNLIRLKQRHTYDMLAFKRAGYAKLL